MRPARPALPAAHDKLERFRFSGRRRIAILRAGSVGDISDYGSAMIRRLQPDAQRRFRGKRTGESCIYRWAAVATPAWRRDVRASIVMMDADGKTHTSSCVPFATLSVCARRPARFTSLTWERTISETMLLTYDVFAGRKRDIGTGSRNYGCLSVISATAKFFRIQSFLLSPKNRLHQGAWGVSMFRPTALRLGWSTLTQPRQIRRYAALFSLRCHGSFETEPGTRLPGGAGAPRMKRRRLHLRFSAKTEPYMAVR